MSVPIRRFVNVSVAFADFIDGESVGNESIDTNGNMYEWHGPALGWVQTRSGGAALVSVASNFQGDYTLMGAFNANGSGIAREAKSREKAFQIVIPAGMAATVAIQGSLDGANWEQVASVTATDVIVSSDPLLLYRVVVSGLSGGKNILTVAVTRLVAPNPTQRNNLPETGTFYEFTKTAHTLAVGDWVIIQGTGSAWDGTVMPVYAVPTANTFRCYNKDGVALPDNAALTIVATMAAVIMVQ